MIVPEHLLWAAAAFATGTIGFSLALIFVLLDFRHRIKTLEGHVQNLRWMRKREERNAPYTHGRPRPNNHTTRR